MDKTNRYKPKDSCYYWIAMYRLLKNIYFVNRDCGKNNGNVCQQGWSISIGDNAQIWAIGVHHQVPKRLMDIR